MPKPKIHPVVKARLKDPALKRKKLVEGADYSSSFSRKPKIGDIVHTGIASSRKDRFGVYVGKDESGNHSVYVTHKIKEDYLRGRGVDGHFIQAERGMAAFPSYETPKVVTIKRRKGEKDPLKK